MLPAPPESSAGSPVDNFSLGYVNGKLNSAHSSQKADNGSLSDLAMSDDNHEKVLLVLSYEPEIFSISLKEKPIFSGCRLVESARCDGTKRRFLPARGSSGRRK